MNGRKIVESFNCAIEGIIEVIKSERHMQFHVFMSLLVMLAAIIFNLTKIEIAMLVICVALVWITEIINTAMEAVVDLYIKEYHDLAKLAKDAAAGAVFVASMTAVIVGYLIIYNHFEKVARVVVYKIKYSPVHASVIASLMVILIVIGAKAFFRKGRPLQGGMPSGHAALAFSGWVSIMFLTDNIYTIFLTFLMAALVAQTRVKSGIHTLKEVAIGALIGAGVTYTILLLIQKLQ